MKKNDLTCPWCTYNEKGCDKTDCDFQTLPYEKDAIIKRIREERDALKEIKEKIIKGNILRGEGDELMAKAVDLVKGIEIMSSRLQSDFGVSLEELKEVVGVEEKSFGDRVRMMAAIAKMKKARGKQK